jgi:hypothetical protein
MNGPRLAMNSRPTFVGTPLEPHELRKLAHIYQIARGLTGKSRHDPAASRLAAMAIRFYQLGVRDEDLLLEKVVNTYARLADEPTSGLAAQSGW